MGGSLSILTPAASQALATLADVKAELGIADAASDDYLVAAIATASDDIARACRRRGTGFGRAVVEETFWQGFGRPDRLWLGLDIAVAIQSVTEDGTALAPADWRLQPGGSLLRLRAGGPSCWSGRTVVVTYAAGYDLPGDAPPALRRACVELVARSWHARGRDPLLRGEASEDVGSRQYQIAAATPMTAGLPDDIAGRLSAFVLWG